MKSNFSRDRFYSELKSALPGSNGDQRKSFVNTIIENDVPLMELVPLLSCGDKTAKRLLWLLSEVGIAGKEKLHSELPLLLKYVEEHHPEYLYQFASYWHYVGIPEENEAQAIDLLFRLFLSPQTNVSIKTRALWALVQLSKKYPGLKQELRTCVEEESDKFSKDFQKRARKILTALK